MSQFGAFKTTFKKESSSSSLKERQNLDYAKPIPTVEYIINEEINAEKFLEASEDSKKDDHTTFYRQNTLNINVPPTTANDTLRGSKLDDISNFDRRQPSFVMREKGI